jgi:glycosyltransferase involved in cell wall biosynthesis
MSSDSGKPFVSVIVPVYNDAGRIAKCIEALIDQTYLKDQYEIIVVDNGSDDNTRDIVRQYPVKLLLEDAIQGSYAARNKGIEHARGEIISFTDSDCIPVREWIDAGVEGMITGGADLVSGTVHFIFSSRPTGSEIYDSLTNMQIEKNIRERKVSKTANLFVHSRVIDTVGPFPAFLRSGGDVWWTGRATAKGFKLLYVPNAEVAHPARRLSHLLEKQFRVGRGMPRIRISNGESKWKCFLYGFFLLLPPNYFKIKKLLFERQEPSLGKKMLSVWCAAWLSRIAMGIGTITSVSFLWSKEF